MAKCVELQEMYVKTAKLYPGSMEKLIELQEIVLNAKITKEKMGASIVFSISTVLTALITFFECKIIFMNVFFLFYK